MIRFKKMATISAVSLMMFFVCACGKLPTVAGKDVDTVKNEISAMNRDYVISDNYNYEFSEEVARGKVLEISPASGTRADKGSTITITISRGKPITVSNFANTSADVAISTLTTMGLAFSSTEEYSEDISEGYVIRSNPAVGEIVEEGDIIELVVSKGTEYRVFPDIDGKNVNEVISLCEEAGVVIDVEYEFDGKISKDSIISYDASSGEKVSVLNPVKVVVSKGPGVVIPAVSGLSKDRVINSLERLGLSYSINETNSDQFANGNVISANYEEGTRVDEGTNIVINVSKGTVEEEFKRNCKSVTYDDLLRNPTSYKDVPIKMRVYIKEIEIEKFLGFEIGQTIYATTNNELLILSDGREIPEPALREGDSVTVYGYGNGTSLINVKEKEYFGSLVFGFSYDATVDSYDVPNFKIMYFSF